MNCLPAITGAEIPVRTHGQKLSILFARASSSAPALHGLAKMVDSDACAALAPASPTGSRSDGDRVGDEKERR